MKLALDSSFHYNGILHKASVADCPETEVATFLYIKEMGLVHIKSSIMKFLLLVASIMAQDYTCDQLCTDSSVFMDAEYRNNIQLQNVLKS